MFDDWFSLKHADPEMEVKEIQETKMEGDKVRVTVTVDQGIWKDNSNDKTFHFVFDGDGSCEFGKMTMQKKSPPWTWSVEEIGTLQDALELARDHAMKRLSLVVGGDG